MSLPVKSEDIICVQHQKKLKKDQFNQIIWKLNGQNIANINVVTKDWYFFFELFLLDKDKKFETTFF